MTLFQKRPKCHMTCGCIVASLNSTEPAPKQQAQTRQNQSGNGHAAAFVQFGMPR